LPLNLRSTTCECAHLVTRGHFRSRDKDGGHTIRSAISKNLLLHADFVALFYRIGDCYCRSKFYMTGIWIFDHFCACDLDPMTFIYEIRPASPGNTPNVRKRTLPRQRLTKVIVCQCQTQQTKVYPSVARCTCYCQCSLRSIYTALKYDTRTSVNCINVVVIAIGLLSVLPRAALRPTSHTASRQMTSLIANTQV